MLRLTCTEIMWNSAKNFRSPAQHSLPVGFSFFKQLARFCFNFISLCRGILPSNKQQSCMLFCSFSSWQFPPYFTHCISAITPQPLFEVRESSLLSSLASGSLKDIDSSDLCVAALPPTKVHEATCGMLQWAANFPRLSTQGY